MASAFFGIFFLLIGFVGLKVRRDVLHPAVAFPAVWGITFVTIGLAEPFGYFQIPINVFPLFVVGVLMFVIGAMTIKKSSIYELQPEFYNLDFKRIVWFCALVHVIVIPLAWFEVNKIGEGASDIFALAYRLRVKAVSGEENVGPIVGNYLVVGLYFVPVLLIGWLYRQIKLWQMILVAVPWIVLSILINGRSGLIVLILSLIYVYFSLGGRFRAKIIIFFGVFFAAILVAGNLLVSKIDATIDDGLWPIFQQSIKSFFNYFLQGPILFSKYIDNPGEISPTWDALIFPCYVLNKFNLCSVPSLYQEYMSFSSDGDLGNVYSVFLSIYPDYGWVGVIVILFIYGAWSAFHHARRYRSLRDLLIASFLFSAILLSVFNDSFGPNIYFFIKIIILNIMVFYVFKKA